MQSIPCLKIYPDELEKANSDERCHDWLHQIIRAKDEVTSFVAARLGDKPIEYVEDIEGSFNFSFRYTLDTEEPDIIIRFPKPGHIIPGMRDEKVSNEVQVMQYLSQNTTIPIPHIHSWGLTADSPQKLGPFIIMDYVEGTPLSTLLKQPTEDNAEPMVLNPAIDNALLDKVYRQIASYVLQLSQLTFKDIGAIAKDGDAWSVTKRPFTYNMNKLATIADYPIPLFPTETFDCVSEYFRVLAREHLVQLRIQRNVGNDADIVLARYIARHRFIHLIPTHIIDEDGPFMLFFDDLQPSNILVNPDTLDITAVLDVEFTNVMPVQFTYDPPWWLLLSGPEVWVERGAIDEFRSLYEPRMEQFLKALEEVETTSPPNQQQLDKPRLSARMRESWASGRFWFDYAARRSFDIDAIYWATLHIEGSDAKLFDRETMSFVEDKMIKLKKYKEKCNARFSQETG